MGSRDGKEPQACFCFNQVIIQLCLYTYIWGFGTEPTQRREIIAFLLTYYSFKIYHRRF